MERNKIKPDTILKTFWRDSEHFADLFNAALFDGRQVLKAGRKENGIRCRFCDLGTGKSGKDSLRNAA